MGGIVKVMVPLVALAVAASYLGVVQDILDTVRKSVVGIALCRIDDALYGECLKQADSRVDPLPKDQEEFLGFMQKAFENRGQDVTKDQFGTPYCYLHPAKPPENPTFTVSSAGPNRTFGDDDDLVVHRHGKTRDMTYPPEDIAKVMELKAQQKQQADDQLRQALEEGGEQQGEGSGQEGEGVGGQLGSLLDQARQGIDRLKESISEGLKGDTSSEPPKLDGSLNGLGGN
jgi:DNA-binding transcriptional MerR regulator